MAYKDKEKQREADRARQQRRRDVIKSKGVTNTGRDGQGVTQGITLPKPDLGNTLTTTQTVGATTPKRGKDIKVFADLPADVQQTIDMMSTTDGKLDKTVKANRTAIAINYQHQFPDHYHSTGVV